MFPKLQSTMHVAVTILLLLLSTLSTSSGCIPSERAALLSFKDGFTSDPDGRLSSWHGLDCCRWDGVVCSNTTGHVMKLKLRNTFLDNGSSGLGGEISPSMLHLQHLTYLDLSANNLGTFTVSLPEFLGSLQNLRYLNLSYTYYVGRVPPQFGNLSKLLYLDLSSYNGGLNSTDISWLPRLSLLEYLDMTEVNLGATVGWARAVNMLSSLRVLSLSDCVLTSSGPSVVYSNLTQLQRLDLSLNGINTSNTASWFWNIPTLTHLDLSGNGLSGRFPDTLGNMTTLEVFNLQGNNLTGMIPLTLKNLCSLRIVQLSVNQINGDMIEFMERLPRCALSKLETLEMSTTNVSGELPNWIGQMTNLRDLDLSHNKLSGPISLGIGTLTKLTSMFLQDNNFTGSLSEEHFASLVSLEYIDLSRNYLIMEIRSNWTPPCRLVHAYFPNIKMGPQFPAWLKQQPEILYLDISNAGIVDTLPNWFWRVYSDAIYLNISVNQISGRLPTSLKFMTAALAIYLGSNKLTGSVPLLPANLLVLDLSRNSLSGPIPPNFGAPELVELDASYNKINGTIPASLCQLPNLLHLDLSNNHLIGQLPRCGNSSSGVNLSSMSSASLGLTTLILYNNSLSGKFPVFLKHCKQLTFLDLAHNMFFGSLPTWIGRKLPSLTHLRLRSNMFSGDIPTQLTELNDLQFLDLADNIITGTIPHSLATLEGMTQEHKALDFNPLTGYGASGSDRIVDSLQVVTKGQDRDYTSAVIYMVSLDLSKNNLNGDIPEELCSLTGLINLNLSENHLSGTIPKKIGAIQKLESLDLSVNELSGEIPLSLSDLTSLSHLNLSYNNLSGRIPSGNQLQTLANPASIYMGNIGLCGPPLSKNCSGNGTFDQVHLEGHKGASDTLFFYLGMSVGFVMGLWMIFCALLFKKTWRIAYFRSFDNLYDMIYVFVAVSWARWVNKTATS